MLNLASQQKKFNLQYDHTEQRITALFFCNGKNNRWDTIPLPNKTIKYCLWSPDDRYAMLTFYDASRQCYALDQSNQLVPISGLLYNILFCKWHPQSSYVAINNHENHLNLLSVHDHTVPYIKTDIKNVYQFHWLDAHHALVKSSKKKWGLYQLDHENHRLVCINKTVYAHATYIYHTSPYAYHGQKKSSILSE